MRSRTPVRTLPALSALASALVVLCTVTAVADASARQPSTARSQASAERGVTRSDAAPPSGVAIADHLTDVAARVAPHLARSGERPAVAVVERAALTSGLVGSGKGRELEISTGVLGALQSDAQLAMVLAYELGRAMPSGTVRAPVRRRGLGERVARAAAVGAAAGAASGLVYDELRGSDRIIRHAGSAAAAAAAGTATAAAFDRRGDRPRVELDDGAAEDAMRAVIAAGYDGRAALTAWDALSAASPLGGPDGGLADAKANHKRQKKARHVLRKAPTHVTSSSGHLVGQESYRRAVHSRLDAWRFAESMAPGAPGVPGDSATTSPALRGRPVIDDGMRDPWLVYERSGGITGWRARLFIDEEGRVVSERHERGRILRGESRLTPAELASLQGAVDEVLTLPARRGAADARFLRDGQSRLVSVRTEAGERRVTLSDGHVLHPADWRLVNVLEDLTRREQPPG